MLEVLFLQLGTPWPSLWQYILSFWCKVFTLQRCLYIPAGATSLLITTLRLALAGFCRLGNIHNSADRKDYCLFLTVMVFVELLLFPFFLFSLNIAVISSSISSWRVILKRIIRKTASFSFSLVRGSAHEPWKIQNLKSLLNTSPCNVVGYRLLRYPAGQEFCFHWMHSGSHETHRLIVSDRQTMGLNFIFQSFGSRNRSDLTWNSLQAETCQSFKLSHRHASHLQAFTYQQLIRKTQK